MKFLAIYLIGAAIWSSVAMSAPTVLADFPISGLADRNVQTELPQGVRVEFDPEYSVDGGGAFIVTCQGSGEVSVRLFEASLAEVENTVIWYTASLRSEGVTGKAYLEMLCAFPNGHEYFSRAIPEALTGDQDWRESRTPFFLKKGERPVRATLGVRFEGPGTLWIDQAKLTRGRMGFWKWMDWPGALEGIVWGTLGAAVGIWGGIAGLLSWYGRARRAIMVSMVGLTALGAVLLISGVCLRLAGAAYAVWYPMVLFGALLAIVLGVNACAMARRYRAVEVERMAARDASESL